MWLFSFLLQLYPAGFRQEYGALMEQAWADEWRDATGPAARLRLAVRLCLDLAWQWPEVLWHEVRQDARYGMRTWGRRFALTAVAVLTMGMAVGVSAGVFSVLNALLFRSLPFHEAERLVQFERYFAPVFKGAAGFTEWKRDHTFLADAGVCSVNEYNLNRQQSAVRVKGAETSANFFSLMGSNLHLGRGFAVEEEQPGRGDVVVLSHGLYEQAFGGDARVLGKSISLNGRPMTVIGVAQPGFDFPGNAALWTPTVFDIGRIPKSGVASTVTIGRLAAGFNMEQAQAAFRVVQSRHKEELFNFGHDVPSAEMLPLREQIAGDVGKATRVLFIGVCAVLLIACVNLAHLFLHRFAERSQEFEIRSWLGAGPGRITQQIVTECLILALMAGAAGLGFAWAVARMGHYFFPPVFAFQQYDVFDIRVLLFTLGVSLVCGAVFGWLPAMLRRRGARGRNRLQLTLLAGQACLTALLVMASVDLGGELMRLNQLDRGYRVAGAYTATISLAGTRYDSDSGKRDFLNRALTSVRQLGLAGEVGAIDFLPLAFNTFMGGTFRVSGSSRPELALTTKATPGLIRAIGGTLVAGRDFEPSDQDPNHPVVIVNESFARLEGGARNILGRKLRQENQSDSKQKPPTVIGVVKDFRFESGGSVATVISPFEEDPHNFFSVVVRPKAGAEASISEALKQALSAVDHEVPVYDVMSYEKRLERALARPSFYGVAVLFFGLFSILLTVLNGYSICSSAIDRRRREMGIRAALGATAAQLRWMLLREMTPALLGGIFLGALLGQYSTGLLTHLLDGLKGAPGLWRAAGVAALTITAGATIWLKTRVLLRMRPADQIRT